MSKDKGKCGDLEQCCDETQSVETEHADTNQEPSSNSQEFIDIHPTETLASPVEECGEDLRSGGSTIAEMTEQFSKQCVDSGDEYHSAEEDDKDLDIAGDQFYHCVTDGVSGNNCVRQSGNGVTEESISVEGHSQQMTVSGECRQSQTDSVEDSVTSGASNTDGGQRLCSEDSDSEADGEDTVNESDKPKEVEEDEESRKKLEESLSDEEKLERKEKGQEVKDQGNKSFREGSYKEAIKLYNEALQICPLSFHKERSIMFSNRAACQMKLDDIDDAIKSCSKALELHPHYMKALLRRAELYEKADKLDEALADNQKAVELDPSQHAARHAAIRLADQVKERNEKLKTEMLGKLKDLGNMILKPFGMSTDNFNLQQDPNTGSYSVNFQQGQQNAQQ